jgi:hypothetical protein
MIQGCMIGIPEATVIILTAAERSELEGLARSTKTEYRLRQRARIALLASDGMAGRSGESLAARPVRHRSGACAMPKSGWAVSMKQSKLHFVGWHAMPTKMPHYFLRARGCLIPI